MGWIRTRPDFHTCAPPTILMLRQEGDEWVCELCGTVWTVKMEPAGTGEGFSPYSRKVMRRA